MCSFAFTTIGIVTACASGGLDEYVDTLDTLR